MSEDMPIYEMDPVGAASSAGLSVNELFQYGQQLYLVGAPGRTPEKFKKLWNSWKSGKTNMPLSVEAATKPSLRHAVDELQSASGDF